MKIFHTCVLIKKVQFKAWQLLLFIICCYVMPQKFMCKLDVDLSDLSKKDRKQKKCLLIASALLIGLIVILIIAIIVIEAVLKSKN